jgi:hypothetical protein
MYDGINLNDFQNGKYVIANFTTGNVPTEGQRNIAQTSLFSGKEQPFLYQNYSSTLSFSISIIKNPCMDDNIYFNIQDIEELKRWLCRPAPHVFRLIDSQYSEVFWEGSFNLTEEVVGSKRIGVTMNFVSTRPFALQNDVEYSGTVDGGNSITINDLSVEQGFLYPEMTVVCLESGDLEIHNDFENRTTIIKNCEAEEEITFSKYLQVSSSNNTHDIYNDFNYKFFRICNNYETNENVVTFSLPCKYAIIYNPIRKVIPI